MTRDRKTTAVHRTGYADEIVNILKGKAMREGYPLYRDMINEKFGLDLTTRQVRYFYNNYVKPKEVVTPKEAQDAIEEQRETINVAIEQMDLVELQRERLEKLNDVEPEEMMRRYNEMLGPDDRKKSIWYFIKAKAEMMRQEIELHGHRIEELKEIKQDLDLMKKEPEELDIKITTTEEKEINMDEFDEDLMRELAMKSAGVENVDPEG